MSRINLKQNTVRSEVNPFPESRTDKSKIHASRISPETLYISCVYVWGNYIYIYVHRQLSYFGFFVFFLWRNDAVLCTESLWLSTIIRPRNNAYIYMCVCVCRTFAGIFPRAFSKRNPLAVLEKFMPCRKLKWSISVGSMLCEVYAICSESIIYN